MSTPPTQPNGSTSPPAVSVRGLSYKYKSYSQYAGFEERAEGLHDISIDVPKGARVLVVGGNGAGKSTLLSIIGGRKIVPEEAVRVLGRSAFHDTTLANDVMFLGDWWKTDFFMDISIGEVMKDKLQDARFQRLAKMLDVNLDWRVARVSDGQRRRCQLLANLAAPKQVYLMDEATTDLDVVGRDSLLRMLKQESEKRGVTVLYATHIFDSLEGWPTHILYLNQGRVARFCRMEDLAEYHALRSQGCLQPLYLTVRQWLYAELEAAGRHHLLPGDGDFHADAQGSKLAKTQGEVAEASDMQVGA